MAYIDDKLEEFRELFCLFVSYKGYLLKDVFNKAGLSNSYFFRFKNSDFWNPSITNLEKILFSIDSSVYELVSFMARYDNSDLLILSETKQQFRYSRISRLDVINYINHYFPEDRAFRFESVYHNRDNGKGDVCYSTIVDIADKLRFKPYEVMFDIYDFSRVSRTYES
ncbi:MAG: hypothetical protein K6G51_05010 [Sphaerochaetaceae bacterium]|nr:hypothetical protein [Sphaerochaetaceae bacterium]